MSRRSGAVAIALGALTLAFTTAGCPNAQKNFDDFVARVPVRDAGGSGDGGGVLADVSGTHLLAVSTSIAPDSPIQFITDAKLTTSNDGALLDLTLTPLTVQGRMKTGTPIVVKGVIVSASGTFAIDLGTQTVPGAANPVSGTDIEAQLVLKGSIKSKDRFCGDIEGKLLKPYMADLTGSTWSAFRVNDGTIGDQLPMPEGACPSAPADGGAGD